MSDDTPYTGPLPDHVRNLLEEADRACEKFGKGTVVHFKFTCEHCGARQTFSEPDSFYLSGECEECKHVTDLTKPNAQINFALIARIR